MFVGRNENGYIGLIALLAVLVIMFGWMWYLFNQNWFGNGIVVPQVSENPGKTGDSAPVTTNPGDVNKQLNTLRQDVKSIQDQKDQEIYNELNK